MRGSGDVWPGAGIHANLLKNLYPDLSKGVASSYADLVNNLYPDLTKSVASSCADLVNNLYPDLTKSVASSYADLVNNLYPDLTKSLLPSYAELAKGLYPNCAELGKSLVPSFADLTKQLFDERAATLQATLSRRLDELDEADELIHVEGASDSRVPVAPWRLSERQWSLLRLGAVAFLASDALIYSKLESTIGDAATAAELLWWSAGLSFVLMLMIVDFYDRHGPDSN